MEGKSPSVMNYKSNGGGTGSDDGGSVESAVGLLQSVKEGDEFHVQKKGNGASHLFGRSSPSSARAISDNSPINKRYLKMGILMSDTPTEVSTYRSHRNRSTGSSPSGSHSGQTPPFSEMRRNAGSLQESQGTSLNQSSSTKDNHSHRYAMPYFSSSSQSQGVAVNVRPHLEDNHQDDEIKAEGYEVIDLKDVSSIIDSTNRAVTAQQNVQPSPPISMKSESVNSEESTTTSSPDSGYGNTPEYPNANTSSEAKSSVGESRQNGVQNAHQQRQASEETDGVNNYRKTGNVEREDGNGEEFNSGQRRSDAFNGSNLLTQQAVRGGVHLMRPSTGSSSSAIVSDYSSSGSREPRSRGDTTESLFSVESNTFSPVQSLRGASSGKGEETQVYERNQTKASLQRQNSVPAALYLRGGNRSGTTPTSQPNPSYQVGPFPFHMSPSSGSLGYGNRPPNLVPQASMTSPSGFSELHPSHRSYPSQPHTTGAGAGMPPNQSHQQIQRQPRHSPEARRKKFRSSSLAFTRSTGTCAYR